MVSYVWYVQFGALYRPYHSTHRVPRAPKRFSLWKFCFWHCLRCALTFSDHFSPIDLLNVFEVFLPQLLLYPNAADPLNGAAAALYLRDVATFNKTVQAHVARHASPEAHQQEEDDKMDVDDDLSSLGTLTDDDMDCLIFE